VGELLGRRLRELKRTPDELAEAAHVPPGYINDLIAGRRRPPLPGRTDVYERMTPFLKLGRNDLVACARAERAGTPDGIPGRPDERVERLLLALCEPATAARLAERFQEDSTEVLGFIQRLLDVAQGAVRRTLNDVVALRASAIQRGVPYVELRLRILDFLDATPDSLTPGDVSEFIQPMIGSWDVDLETGVLRVVLRTTEQREKPRRRPAAGPGW
jgi:hypothetical protein